jgi:hypothetical protein
MNTGANNRPKLVAATALMTFALVTAGISIYGWESSAPVVAASNSSVEIEINRPVGKKKKREDSLDPTLRFAKLELSENEEYTGSGRNIFMAYVENEPKKILPNPDPPIQSEQIVPAPIPLKFFGYATMKNAPRKVCVRDEDSVFIAGEGDIVDRRYRIASIKSSSVDVQDLIENRLQTLTLQFD